MRLPEGSKRRRSVLALSSLGALWILSRAFTGSGIERLAPLSPSDWGLLGVRKDYAYVERNREVVGLPIRGGRSRVLTSIPDSPALGVHVTLNESALLVAQVEAGKTEERTVELPDGGRLTTRAVLSPSRARFSEVPLEGGPAHQFPVVIPGEHRVVIGRECFWIRGQPDRLEPVLHPDRFHRFRSIPRSEVVATPLEGGPTRVLASRVPWGTDLQAAGGYLLWLSEQAGSSYPVLHSYRPGDSRVTVLRRFPSTEVPEVHDGRFYWMAGRIPGLPTPSPGEPTGLVSARPDGSDRRVIVDIDAEPSLQTPARVLGGNQGSLYCTFQTLSRFRGRPAMVPVLCRIRAGHNGPLERVKELPPETQILSFDGHYCYFVVAEHPENWFDWSREGVGVQNVRVLYRCRLPDRSLGARS